MVRVLSQCRASFFLALGFFLLAISAQGAGVPTLQTPVDGDNNVSIPVQFTWSAVATATYEVQIAPSASFTTLTIDKKSVNGTSDTETLPPGTKYFWRVQANSGGWPTAASFVTAVNAPDISAAAPAANATGITLPVQFSWGAVASATVYELQLAQDAQFTVGVTDKNTLSSPSDSESLTGGTTYYWHVRAGNQGGGWSGWTSTLSFTTAADSSTTATMGAVVLTSPANGSVDVPASNTFIWQAAAGATSYHLQVAKDSAFAAPTIDKAAIAGTTDAETLIPGTLYYWRVQAITGTLSSDWSTAGSFTTAYQFRPDFQVQAPSDTSFVGADIYDAAGFGEAYRRDTPTGTTTVYNLKVVNKGYDADSVTILGPGALDHWQVKYFDAVSGGNDITTAVTGAGWQVPAINTGGEVNFRVEVMNPTDVAYYSMLVSTYSNNDPTQKDAVVLNTQTTYVALQPIAAPTLTAPADGATGIQNPVSLTWTASSATVYELRVATDAGFTNVVVDKATLATTSDSETLNAGTTYYWTVRGGDGTRWGDWSSTAAFTTVAPAATHGVGLDVRTSTLGDPVGTGVAEQFVSSNFPGIYLMTINNTGNAADTFTISSSEVTRTGWMVYCFNAAGMDITRKITGGAKWTTPSIAAGSSYTIRLEVTPSSGVSVNDMQDVPMTVTSTSDTSQTTATDTNTTRIQ